MPLSRLGGLAFLTFLSVTGLADTQAQVSRTQADDRNSLSGVVVTKDRPDAVRQVTVVAAEASTGRLWSTMTDDGGAFRISELPPGEYTLSARKPAYLTSIYGALEAGAAGTRIRVPINGPITPLRLSIARGGVIAGMVRGMDGEPAPDVVVSVMGASGWSTAVWTNFRGEYRVYGLPADAYAVSAKPESALTPRQMGQSGAPLVTMPISELDRRLAELARRTPGRVATSAPPTIVATAAARSNQSMELVAGLPDVFYPGSVALGEGEEVTNIDLMLSLAGGASVNVTVLDEQGQPAATARVSARAFPRGPSAQVYGGRGANGTFRVANMVPGRYLIEAWIDGASGSGSAGVQSAWANAVADLTAGTAGRGSFSA